MLLEIEKQASIPVAPEAAWALLHDFPELTTCIPNVSDLEQVEPDRRYGATISDKIGPFRVTDYQTASFLCQRRAECSTDGQAGKTAAGDAEKCTAIQLGRDVRQSH